MCFERFPNFQTSETETRDRMKTSALTIFSKLRFKS